MVSLVLNGRKQSISAETYDRIWQHAVKRGYRPKGMRLASTPAAVKTHTVGFILRAPLRLNTLGSYFGSVQHGLHTALQKKNLATTFLGSEDQIATEQLARIFQPGHTLQGVVLLGEVSRAFLLELRQHERRLVTVSARCLGLCHSVIGNEPQALEQLVGHLQGLGHRRIGWLGGNQDLSRHQERFAAFMAALQQGGLAFDPRYVVRLQQADRAEGVEAVHHILSHQHRRDFPTAFVCYNSLMAHGAARAFMRQGWKVPADVSVAGADTPRPELEAKPRITGAGSNPEDLGAAAAKLVLHCTGEEGEAFTDIMLPSQLVIGESTGAAR